MKGYTSYDAELMKGVSPSATAATVSTDAIDLGKLSKVGVRSEPFELEIAIPAFTAAELPTGAKLTFELQSSETKDFTTKSTILTRVVGNGEATDAKCVRYNAELDSDRYWRVSVSTTLTGGATVAATAAKKSVFLSYVC